ncbi:unnamed protein product [Lampetra fluviatilis]
MLLLHVVIAFVMLILSHLTRLVDYEGESVNYRTLLVTEPNMDPLPYTVSQQLMAVAIVIMAAIQIFTWRRWSSNLSDTERYNAVLCEENVKLRQRRSLVEDDNAFLRVREVETRKENEALRREILLRERAMVLRPQVLCEKNWLVKKENQRLRHEKLIRVAVANAAAANVTISTNAADAATAANANANDATTAAITTNEETFVAATANTTMSTNSADDPTTSNADTDDATASIAATDATTANVTTKTKKLKFRCLRNLFHKRLNLPS